MKKFIVVTLALIFSGLVFSSCATQSKCPAYGHYSQLEQPVPESENAL